MKAIKNDTTIYSQLVFRIVESIDGALDLEYLVFKPKNSEFYHLPKGKLKSEETPELAVFRITEDQTGIRSKIVYDLVRTKLNKKPFEVYLSQYTGGRVLEDGRCPDHNGEDARFVSVNDAKDLLKKEYRFLINKATKLIRDE